MNRRDCSHADVQSPDVQYNASRIGRIKSRALTRPQDRYFFSKCEAILKSAKKSRFFLANKFMMGFYERKKGISAHEIIFLKKFSTY